MRHLYLHGFASAPTSQKAVRMAKALAEHGIALEVPDLNIPSFEHLTITAVVGELERRLAGQRQEPAVLWGSSLGGYLAALLASAHPNAVSRIVLMAPAVDFPAMFPLMMRPAYDAWARGESVPVRHHAARAELPLAADLVNDCPKWPVRPRVDCPALVLAARHDAVIPLHTIEAWAQAQPQTELQVLDTDHPMENVIPELLAHAMRFVGLTRNDTPE